MMIFDYDKPENNIDRVKTYVEKIQEAVSEAKDKTKENDEEE